MKKTFPLHLAGKADERVLEAIRRDLRRYVNRERRKALPEGFAIWEFDCRVGAAPENAGSVAVPGLNAAVDAIAQSGAPAVYVEILARAAQRAPKPAEPAQ
jgi:hypothetical protein